MCPSVRDGHASEDSHVKTPDMLFKIYLESVGRGSSLILNLPPDRRGLLHENDVEVLLEWKALLNEAFAVNLASDAKVKADTWRGKSNRHPYHRRQTKNGEPESQLLSLHT
jgi:alpha-L-fucosidase